MLWSFSSSFTRISLLCFYYRLIEHVKFQRYKWIIHVTMALSISLQISYLGGLLGACTPLHTMWDGNLAPKCMNVPWFLFIISIINTFMDLAVVLLPAPAIFLLHLEKSQKWSVIILLCLGIFTTAAGSVRCFFVYKAVLQAEDMMWWAQPHWISSEVENSVALVSNCEAMIHPSADRCRSVHVHQHSGLYWVVCGGSRHFALRRILGI